MTASSSNLFAPPDDPVAHLALLEQAFAAGDIIAVFQAVDFCRTAFLPTPEWALYPYEETLIGALQRKTGTLGKGNSAFGALRKSFVRTVRASAFLYVRAWQKDPRRYHDLPSNMFEFWFDEEFFWQSNRKAVDAARLAANGLKGSGFQSQSSTIRRSANCFLFPVLWGRREAEAKLGLRDTNGVFGEVPSRFPPHVQKLIDKWDAKS